MAGSTLLSPLILHRHPPCRNSNRALVLVVVPVVIVVLVVVLNGWDPVGERERERDSRVALAGNPWQPSINLSMDMHFLPPWNLKSR